MCSLTQMHTGVTTMIVTQLTTRMEDVQHLFFVGALVLAVDVRSDVFLSPNHRTVLGDASSSPLTVPFSCGPTMAGHLKWYSTDQLYGPLLQ